MIRRILATLFLAWAIGFLWFAIALPQPLADTAPDAKTDAVIVPTGGAGRIRRGMEVLDRGLAEYMLVTGVAREVTPEEFAAEFDVSDEHMKCCVTLGYSAVDTRSNGAETAKWVDGRDVGSIRLVTTDWHMRRAAGEIARNLPAGITMVRDAVPSEPSLFTLFLEYHKLLASALAGLIEG